MFTNQTALDPFANKYHTVYLVSIELILKLLCVKHDPVLSCGQTMQYYHCFITTSNESVAFLPSIFLFLKLTCCVNQPGEVEKDCLSVVGESFLSCAHRFVSLCGRKDRSNHSSSSISCHCFSHPVRYLRSSPPRYLFIPFPFLLLVLS